MHLSEILALRHVPGAGIFLALTRRCPLSCGHCSTSSKTTSEEAEAGPYVRLVESFTSSCRPEVLALTGGEPLLRASLVQRLVRQARSVGTRSYLLTGAWFAQREQWPEAVIRAIDMVDHLAVSIDRFHEAEVPRRGTYALLHHRLASGRAASLQAVGDGPDDPYLHQLCEEVRREFDDRLPVLVGAVGANGRAKGWLRRPVQTERPVEIEPCHMASWPVVDFRGNVVACCNQDVVDGPAPEHLRLGAADVDGWPELRRRLEQRPHLRAIRTAGPRMLGAEWCGRATGEQTVCEACRSLPFDAATEARVEQALGTPLWKAVDIQLRVTLAAHSPLPLRGFDHMATLGM